MASPIKPPVPLSEWDHHAFRALEPIPDGTFVSGNTCLICAGPPLLEMTGWPVTNQSRDNSNQVLSDLAAYPLGLVQGVSIGSNIQQIRVFELGSMWDYIATGRSVIQLTVSKIFFAAGNLLRFLYAYYGTSGVVSIEALFSSPVAAAGALNDVYISPGSRRIFMNTQSDLFRNPIGILLIMSTTQNQYVGSFYLERCMVHGHNIGFDAQGIIIQENATLTASRMRPVYLGDDTSLAASVKNFLDLFNLGGAL